MFSFRIIFFLLGSFLLFSCSRTPIHDTWVWASTVSKQESKLENFKPKFGRALYQTSVDVVGNHLSGLLLIKKMPDSSTRIVFTSEMGVGYFDFEFSKSGKFRVYSIIKKMNRKAVKKTLRNDFQLVLMSGVGESEPELRYHNQQLFHIFKQGKGYNYYITDSLQTRLILMERASAKKVVVNAWMQDFKNGIPDSISISHTGFQFNIGLKRISNEETSE